MVPMISGSARVPEKNCELRISVWGLIREELFTLLSTETELALPVHSSPKEKESQPGFGNVLVI